MNPLFAKAKSFLRARGLDMVRHKPLPEWLNLHQVDVVIDIGANDGRYAQEIRESGWQGRITSVEPQPTVFDRLRQRFENDSLWQGMQIGLGSNDGMLNMNVHEMDVLSSFLENIEDHDQVATIEVNVHRADTIFPKLTQGGKRPFVKLDTQGFELEIINGFGEMTDNVVGWQLELSVEPLYKGQPSIEEVIGVMRAKGFSLWKIITGLRVPDTLRALEYDGIFFRND